MCRTLSGKTILWSRWTHTRVDNGCDGVEYTAPVNKFAVKPRIEARWWSLLTNRGYKQAAIISRRGSNWINSRMVAAQDSTFHLPPQHTSAEKELVPSCQRERALSTDYIPRMLHADALSGFLASPRIDEITFSWIYTRVLPFQNRYRRKYSHHTELSF